MSGNRPPSSEIAAYAQTYTTCPDCGAFPSHPCVEQAEAWRSVCKGRYATAAAEYIPRWKDANGRRRPAA